MVLAKKIIGVNSLHDLNLMVDPIPVTKAWIRRLPMKKRLQLAKYWWRSYLRASDNIVAVPPKPAFWKKYEMEYRLKHGDRWDYGRTQHSTQRD